MDRRLDDAERLFPRVSHATAATTGEVVINGKALKLWTFAQLEALSVAALRQRALAIRDLVGEAFCPPMPSAQQQDLVRWILHVQGDLTQQPVQVGPAKGVANGHMVPQSFAQESKERPILMVRAESPRGPRLPFGPRTGQGHDATRDHYADLKFQRKEFKEAPVLGIESMRPGGEGRRHLFPKENMVASGISAAEPRGIQTLKPGGEGRRYLSCDDHLMQQKQQFQASTEDTEPTIAATCYATSPRSANSPVKHVSETHMLRQGFAMPESEAPVGGERRRHLSVQDHMISQGISAANEADIKAGRKYLDGFAGPRMLYGDAQSGYQSSWKKDPSRLQGTSLIC